MVSGDVLHVQAVCGDFSLIVLRGDQSEVDSLVV